MSHIFASLLLVYTVFCAALMSPGPDFFITLRNAIRYGTKAGVFTALGIAAGLIVHMSYCVAGIGLLISRSIVLFDIIKWIGAAYLFYIGLHAIRSKGMDVEEIKRQVESGASEGMTTAKAFRSGLITNLFNPKATMFFLALFSQMLDPHMPMVWLAGLAAVCIATAFCWFSAVSMVMTMPPLRRAYARASKIIDRVSGAFFMALGVRLAVSRL